MPTKIGIAYSNRTNTTAAAIEVASKALKSGGISRPDFALAFCSGKHNPNEFLENVQSVLGNIPLIGGSSMGIITDEFIGYEGFEVGITVFSSESITFNIFSQPGIDKDEKKAGEELAKQIAAISNDTREGLLVFYDSSKQQQPPMLNFATWLFEGLETFLPKHITCAGGGLLADMLLKTTYQFFNNEVLTQHAVAVLIGKCNMHTTILHGCRPASAYLTITKANGPVIAEIDNKPALEMIDELLGDNHGIKWKDFSLFVTLGVNRGEKFEEFNEKNYANRLVLAVDEASKSLIMFEPDLKEGDEVQLMQRSMNVDYIKLSMDDLKRKTGSAKPVFAFYINCAGRARPYAGGKIEDAEEIQQCIGSVPFMGFYSGVEVAKVKDKLQALDWTGVLCTITE